MPRPKVDPRTEPIAKAKIAIGEAVGKAQEEHRLTNDEVIHLLSEEISHRTHWQIRAEREEADRAKRCSHAATDNTGPDCCDRAGEYNGFGSGPLKFTCPKHCSCHD